MLSSESTDLPVHHAPPWRRSWGRSLWNCNTINGQQIIPPRYQKRDALAAFNNCVLFYNWMIKESNYWEEQVGNSSNEI